MKTKITDETFYLMALHQTEKIGPKLARKLIGKFGSASAVFQARPKEIAALSHFGRQRLESIQKEIDKSAIERELEFMLRHNIQMVSIADPEYPEKLKTCHDAPLLLFFKGNAKLNPRKAVSIVGTRRQTDYGRQCTEQLIGDLQQSGITVISGLAFGIDGIAHRAAVQAGLPTIGVLAHGLDRLYPSQHEKLAQEMIANGGLLSEYPSGTVADAKNFPMRNRIVAGMADVTIVVETGQKGGSMITAKLASSYNREVMAFPGRTIDPQSKGCNYLIRTQIAGMITGATDLLELMNWNESADGVPEVAARQTTLFSRLNPEECSLAELLKQVPSMHIDELQLKSSMPSSKLSASLLSLEMEGVIRSLPGKRYRLS